MAQYLLKIGVTTFTVIIVSEIAKRNDRLGAFIAALPIVTLLVLMWLYLENQPPEKIANHAWYTFWYVLPTLPMFLAFPMLYNRFGFWLSLLMSVGITAGSFGMLAVIVRRFGVELF